MHTRLIAGAVVILGILVGAYYFWTERAQAPGNPGVACTQEAKQCPDGSYVGRTGPHCEFSPCPDDNGPKNSDNSLNALPTSGSAPLAVTFVSKYGDAGSEQPSHFDGQDTLIDFGDGTALLWVRCVGSGGVCDTPVRISHTYTSAGRFAVTLKKSGGLCFDGPCPSPVLGTAVVTVSGR